MNLTFILQPEFDIVNEKGTIFHYCVYYIAIFDTLCYEVFTWCNIGIYSVVARKSKEHYLKPADNANQLLQRNN